jgi:hypothetical protein
MVGSYIQTHKDVSSTEQSGMSLPLCDSFQVMINRCFAAISLIDATKLTWGGVDDAPLPTPLPSSPADEEEVAAAAVGGVEGNVAGDIDHVVCRFTSFWCGLPRI